MNFTYFHRYFPIGAIILITLFSSCFIVNVNDDDGNNKKASADFSYAVALGNKNAIEVINMNGDIVINGRDDIDSVIITGERIVQANNKDEAEAALANLTVDVSTTASTVSVVSKQPSTNNGMSYSINYGILIPKNWSVHATGMNGKVEISYINNSVTVGNMNGEVNLESIDGNVSVGLLNGPIKCQMTLPLNGNCQLETLNGTIDLDIPQSTSANINATVINGKLSISGLTITGLIEETKHLEGRLGQGEGTIQLSVTNGSINLRGH
jgi:hypothetical protein